MKATDWISVKDKLPKLNERVLICRKLGDGSICVDFAMRVTKTEYLPNIDKFITKEIWNVEDVTHWQRIVLPNEQKSEDISERDIIYKFLQSDNPKGIMEIMNYPYDEDKSNNKNCLEFVNKIKEEGRIKELLNAIK